MIEIKNAAMNRWLISGTLTVLTELHIGDGNAGLINHRSRPADKDTADEHDASTVAVDCDGRACLPGSSIKGPLRELVKTACGWDGRAKGPWLNLLGHEDAEVGGKLMFLDARWKPGSGCQAKTCRKPSNVTELNQDRTHPWWDDHRRTCVAACHARDRKTNTVADQKFYHIEYVPPGEEFLFRIGGEKLEAAEAEALIGLLKKLEALEESPPVAFGALESRNWGRLRWKIESAKCLGLDEIQQWLKNGTRDAGYTAVQRFGKERLIDFLPLDTLSLPRTLVVDLHICIDSPWLIGDPRQAERGQWYKQNDWKNEQHGAKPPDSVALLDEDGKPFDPAKSLAGALRAQSERILRTCEIDVMDPVISLKRKDSDGDLKNRDPASQLFGFTGWKSPLEVSPARIDQDPGCAVQEFVAIDRFTQGSDDGLKFNAEPVHPGTLKASLKIDLNRLEKTGNADVCIALLAFVLRDLDEGDIVIGRKSSIGYGECGIHESTMITEEAGDPRELRIWLESDPVRNRLQAFDNFIQASVPAGVRS